MKPVAGTKYYSNTREEILDFIPAGSVRVLDVGCGGGGFGRTLKAARAVEVWGVEPVAEAAAMARADLDRVVEGYFDPAVDLPRGYFDAITFNDSLEHFPDVFPPLKLAAELLRPGGVIVVSLPNFRYLENIKHILIEKDFCYADNGILDRTHLRFFTLKSMQRMFQEAGLVVLETRGINPHWWSGWKIRLLRLLFGRHLDDMKYLQYVSVVQPAPPTS
ncbi:MAG: class I SAM-dependent methyltransferase [Thiobacillus sp.]